MAEGTNIEWADDTFNPWWGCTRVSDGCKNCYAESWDKRCGGKHWGPKAPYKTMSAANWNKPLKWNDEAAGWDRPRRVFCASMGDVFDADAPDDQRARLWDLIYRTPNLEWLLLTKRPQNWPMLLPEAEPRHFRNIRLGITAEHVDAMYERVPPLAFASSIGWPTFVSYEPALGLIDWDDWLSGGPIDWVVAGGESGPGARPAHPDWFRVCRDACQKHHVPFLFKQVGEWAWDAPAMRSSWEGEREIFDWPQGNCISVRLGKKAAGRLLDGREHLEFPT